MAWPRPARPGGCDLQPGARQPGPLPDRRCDDPGVLIITGLIRRANEVRERVIRALSSYLELSKRMITFEELFQTQVLHAGHQLRAIIEQRRRLEAEYDRIRSGIERGDYRSASEISDDVQEVLREVRRDQWDEPPLGALVSPELHQDDLDGGLDENTKRIILRDFRRIVLPRVHSDTSDTPFEVFDAAHAVYQAKDYVLMESFVIQYRGELSCYHDSGEVVSLAQAKEWLGEYQSAAERLAWRLELLKKNMTDGELDNPREVQQRMAQQNREFLQAIDEESERLLKLRNCLERLIDQPHGGKKVN